MVSVLSSTTIRGGSPAPAIACATSIDGLGTGKAGHDDRRVPRELADIGGDGDVGLRQFGSRCGVNIKTDDPPAALDQIAGDRALP